MVHRVVGGPVEQFGDVDGHEVVDSGQLALGEPLQCGQRRLDPGLRADHVVENLLALLGGQIQCREHFEVGAHRRERGA